MADTPKTYRYNLMNESVDYNPTTDTATVVPKTSDSGASGSGSTPAPSSPYTNGKDPSGGLAPGYSLVNGQLTYTGTNSNGQTAVDPITQYYQNLADPAVADQPLREQIQKNMQTALDAIDSKYLSIYSDRLGQTRALNSRSGTTGSDFGNSALDSTKTITDQQKGAEQAAVRADYEGQLNKLAADEIAARKADQLGQAQAAQTAYEKTKQSSLDLIKQMASTNQQLTDAQRQILSRNSGLDNNMFDLTYNANKPATSKIDYTYDKDAHAFYGVDPTTGKLSVVKDTSYSPDADIVLSIMQKYPDAGITLKDDLITAQKKIGSSKIYQQSTRLADGSSSSNPQTPPKDYPTAAKIDDWILANKKANPDVPYENLWGQLADQLKQQGVNPSDFDKEFWKLLHPEGIAGYQKYVTDKNKSSGSSNGLDFNSL